MRGGLLALMVASAVLAGCTGVDPTGTSGAAFVPPAAEDVPEGSHPDYGFPVEESTPEAEPESADDAPEAAPEDVEDIDDVDDVAEAEEPEEPEVVYPESWTRPAKRPLPVPIAAFSDTFKETRGQGVSGGAGIAIWGHYAFVGDYGSGAALWVVDIMEPEAPQVVAHLPGVPVRDADIIAFPDGRLYLVTAAGDSSDEIHVYDVTDPVKPEFLSIIRTGQNNHNVAIVPGTPLIYNAPSSGTTIEIWSVLDPYNPKLVQTWANGAGCHDIYFHIDNAAGLYRGYCAGIDDVQIWDVTDAEAPTLIHEEKFPLLGVQDSTGISPVSFSHLAIVNHDATVLIVGDETGGGVAPGCDARVQLDPLGLSKSGPLGNLWFYDISNEKDWVLKGSVSASAWEATTSCTAHFGRVIEDTNHMVAGFYTAGVLLIDFNDLDNPKVLDQTARGSVWDAWYYQGYVFTGDMSRGMDIYTFV